MFNKGVSASADRALHRLQNSFGNCQQGFAGQAKYFRQFSTVFQGV